MKLLTSCSYSGFLPRAYYTTKDLVQFFFCEVRACLKWANQFQIMTPGYSQTHKLNEWPVYSSDVFF